MQFWVKIAIFLGVISCYSQQNKIDSINKAISASKSDTTKLRLEFFKAELESNYRITYWDSLAKKAQYLKMPGLQADAYNNLGYLYQNSGILEKAIANYDQSIVLFNKINLPEKVAFGYYNKAYCYRLFSKYEQAEKAYAEAINFCVDRNNKKIASYCYNDLSIIAGFKGNIPQSIIYIEKSIQMLEKLQDLQGLGAAYSNLASIYYYQSDIEKAESIYQKCLELYTKANYTKGISLIYANLAAVHSKNKRTSKALECYHKSNHLREIDKDFIGVSDNYNSMAAIYISLDSSQKASDYLLKAQEIKHKLNDEKGLISIHINLAQIEINLNNFKKAKDYANDALYSAKQLGIASGIRDAAEKLYEIAVKTKDYDEALNKFELYIQMRDSILNQETQKAIIKSQLKYDYEKKAAADSVMVAEERKISQLKLKQEKAQKQYLYVGLFVITLFGIFMFNRFQIAKKQKTIIEEQKTLVEKQKELVDQKQKEILDSIRYAKRIQLALLPSENYIIKKMKI
jgi:tetratricopeptide (TPR) repeat protein